MGFVTVVNDGLKSNVHLPQNAVDESDDVVERISTDSVVDRFAVAMLMLEIVHKGMTGERNMRC